MSEIIRTHAALFDELERQGVYCVDIGRLTQAVIRARAIIESQNMRAAPYQRCEACE